MMCIASIKSATAAEKAKRALVRNGIGCTVVSLDPMLTKRGCAWGIEFRCLSEYDAKGILRSAHVAYGELIIR